MRNLVKQFSDLFEESEEFQRRAGHYSRAMKSEEWKFLNDAILMIRGQMALDMFSHPHTNSDPVEKDVTQRTYYNINMILDFLANPNDWIRKKSKLKQKYADITGKLKQQAGGGKK